MARAYSDSQLALTVERRILSLRGHRVLLDYDLASLYGVETRALKQAVKRNLDRFPADFMFELSAAEIEEAVSQNVIPRRDKLGGAVPMAFTEQGVAMLSRADLARKLEALEKKYDGKFRLVFDAIRQLMDPPDPSSKTEIGFHVREEAARYKVRRR
jgi:hypothetical protein